MPKYSLPFSGFTALKSLLRVWAHFELVTSKHRRTPCDLFYRMLDIERFLFSVFSHRGNDRILTHGFPPHAVVNSNIERRRIDLVLI